MKKYVTPYLFTLTFIFGLFFVIALFLVSLDALVAFSSSTYRIIILITSYITIMAGSYLFIHFIPSAPLIHSGLFALLYLIISYLTCNGVTHLLHLCLKPFVFIVCSIIFSLFQKDSD